MIKHVSITVFGKVQGVGFRYSAIEKAIELGLTGIINNYQKNQVQIEAEGEVDQLKQFLAWCHRGPQGARVDKVDYASSEQLQKYEKFMAEL
jgi:acylphosphatase